MSAFHLSHFIVECERFLNSLEVKEMSEVLRGLLVSSKTCTRPECAPGVCVHPENKCLGTQWLDYMGVPVSDKSASKSPLDQGQKQVAR